MKNILITGCAGFIGFHIASKLLKKGYRIYGIDILTKSYDINLKKLRLKKLKNKNFYFKKIDISSIYKGFKKGYCSCTTNPTNTTTTRGQYIKRPV